MISMIMSLWNRANLLENTLQSIALQKHKHKYEIIIIDDGSNDEWLNVVRRFTLPIRAFQTRRTEYANAAWPINCGVKQAKGEYILYASPEVIHYGDTFDSYHDLLSRYDSFIVSKVFDLDRFDNRWVSRNRGKWSKNIDLLKILETRPPLVSLKRQRRGMCFLGGWRKSSFMEVGGFDEDFTYPGYEDLFFIEQWEKAGKKFNFTFALKGYHHLSGYHQYHRRHYWKRKTKPSYRKMANLYLKKMDELKKRKQFVPSNSHREEWGILPPDAEVAI